MLWPRVPKWLPLFLFTAATLAGCHERTAPPATSAAMPAADTRPVDPTRAGEAPSLVRRHPVVPRPHFTDVAVESGIEFRHDADIVPGRFFLPEVMGAGLGWLDYDRDGRLDLFAANGRPVVVTPGDAARVASTPREGQRLFRQAADGRFTDASDAAGANVDAYGQGVAVADYDADGFDDSYLSAYGDDELLRNNGDGTFAKVTAAAGATDEHWSAGCLWLDLDGDRLLDLYVANYLDVIPATHRVCVHAGGPGYCGPGPHHGVPDAVYLNRGDGSFAQPGPGLGLGLPASAPGKGLGVLAADFDDDLIPELYVANDMEANFLYRRASARGEPARYEEVARDAGCAVGGDGLYEASMGVACGDLDGDARPDLYLTHYYHMKNTFYSNLGGLLFEDRSGPSGVAAATYDLLGFGTAAADFDRDGDLDLFAANGHVLGPDEPPFQMRPGLLVNDGVARFAESSPSAGPYFSETNLGRGTGLADYDDDGDLDLAVSHLDRPLALLSNRTDATGPFIGFELVPEHRVPPVGGRVRVINGDRSWTLPVTAGGSYLSSSDRRLFVGLGRAGGPVAVEVFWPSGKVSRFEGLGSNCYWRIYESARRPEPRSAAGPR